MEDRIVLAGLLLVVPMAFFLIETSTLLLLESRGQHLHHVLQVGDASVGPLPSLAFLGRVVDTFSAGLGTALAFGILGGILRQTADLSCPAGFAGSNVRLGLVIRSH